MAERGKDGLGGHAPRSVLYEYAETVHQGDPPPRDDSPASPPSAEGDVIAQRRREFAVLLGEFRRTPVLVPVDEDEAPLTSDYGGVRWLYAFSDEPALARFAIVRGEGSREWTYRRILGARLLDVGTRAAGVPCGVALDVGSDGDGVLFPPVAGIVPDAVAVDVRPTADGNGRSSRDERGRR